jgi:transposase-like protein
MSTAKYPPDVKAQARQWLLEGRTITDVARTLGVPFGTVRGWRDQFGLPPAVVGAYPPEMKAEARALYLDGVGVASIAERFGVALSTAKNWMVGLPKHHRRNAHKWSLADVRYVLGRLDGGDEIAEVAEDLRIAPELIQRWVAEDLEQRRARRLAMPVRERYRIPDPAREMAISGAWR